MARVRFTRDFDWPSTGQWHTAYKAETELTVKRDVADAAIAAGAAEEIKAPSLEESEAAPDRIASFGQALKALDSVTAEEPADGDHDSSGG